MAGSRVGRRPDRRDPPHRSEGPLLDIGGAGGRRLRRVPRVRPVGAGPPARPRPEGRQVPPLPSRLRDQGRGKGPLPGTDERRRRAPEPGLRPSPRGPPGPHREETVLPLSAGRVGVLPRHRGVPLALPVLPELADLPVQPGGSSRRVHAAGEGGRGSRLAAGARHRVHLQRAHGPGRVPDRRRPGGEEAGNPGRDRQLRIHERSPSRGDVRGVERRQDRPQGIQPGFLPGGLPGRARPRAPEPRTREGRPLPSTRRIFWAAVSGRSWPG